MRSRRCWLAAAIAIRLESPGPVLYRQRRVGRDGEIFELFKLRTMRQGADPVGVGTAVTSGDPRVTRVGRLLRRFSLDELPNLFNVLRGEMRIVGPRATLPAQVELYTPRQRRRLDLRPGVTGWAQIHGRAGIPWEERIELDVWYVEHRSLRLDLKILARTPRALLGGAGRVAVGSVRGLLARLAAEAGRRARAGEASADGPGNLAEGLPPGGRGSRAPLVQLPGGDRQPARAPRGEFTEEDARRWVERAIEQAGDPEAEDRKWAVEVEGIDEPVGYTALYGLNRQTAPELGAIMGDERVRGRGVGREAERLTNLKAFEEFGAHKVYGRIPATNEAAKKAVIYNGWRQEGVLRKQVRHGDELIDVELWGGFREDLPEPPEE